jgi:hypothetical protein
MNTAPAKVTETKFVTVHRHNYEKGYTSGLHSDGETRLFNLE